MTTRRPRVRGGRGEELSRLTWGLESAPRARG